MRFPWRSVLSATSCLVGAGCMTIQAIEPILAPPHQFRADTTTNVEFVSPMAVGFRCAERGAKFLGLPAVNAVACADTKLITMIDPCMTLTAGKYAQDLCASLGAPALAAPRPSSSDPMRATQVAYVAGPKPHLPLKPSARATEARLVTFASAENVYVRCASSVGDRPDSLNACSTDGIIVISNPCGANHAGWYERTLCHELAHANGWSANHVDGAPLPPIHLASESPEASAHANRQSLVDSLASR
jgi:hypothetical protein